jgi:hypothetical protein
MANMGAIGVERSAVSHRTALASTTRRNEIRHSPSPYISNLRPMVTTSCTSYPSRV